MRRKLLLHPSLSQALGAFTNISQLKQVHAHVLVSGLAYDDFTSSRILACAAVSPVADVTYAEMIFDHTERPSIFMFNTMIMAFERISQSLKCISLYIRMLQNQIQPDKFTYPFLLRSCSISNALGLGEQIHCHVVKFGLDSDVFVLNNIISMYTKCGGLNCAQRLFEEFPSVVDVVSWTSLLTGYSSSGEIDLARKIFDEMPCKNTVSWNAMISGYVQCGRINEAWRLFSEMPERDAASWSAMISGYSQCGMCTEALNLFKEMVVAAVVPNDPALVSTVSACAQLRALEEGKWLHDYIERENFHVNVTLGTALIDMYGKCGSIEQALYVFNSMPEKNVMSWNSAIASLAFSGYGKQALSLFWRMRLIGPTPNAITFMGVLSGCSHSGLVDEGYWVFNLMTELYGIKPQLEHYSIMVDLLGRAGLIEEALEFLEAMPVEPHSGLLGALVGACRIHGNIGLGEELGKRLVDMDPHNSGRYALLSNILASAKRWDDVAMVGNLLKDRRVQKSPGNSVLE